MVRIIDRLTGLFITTKGFPPLSGNNAPVARLVWTSPAWHIHFPEGFQRVFEALNRYFGAFGSHGEACRTL